LFARSWLLIIHDAITILPKLSVSESIAFSGVSKVLGLLWFYLPRMPHDKRSFQHYKADKNLFAYNQGIREGDTRGTSFPGPVVAGNREDENSHVKFFCNQAQNC